MRSTFTVRLPTARTEYWHTRVLTRQCSLKYGRLDSGVRM